MISVRIADLKNRLSEHLRKVRAGRSVTILDRDTPIARIVPYETNGSSLTIRSSLAGSPTLQRVSLPPPLRLPKDVIAFLMEERQGGAVIAYLDSSVLLRVVLGQPNALKEWRSIKQGVASRLVGVECLCTLDRIRITVEVEDKIIAIRREGSFRLLETLVRWLNRLESCFPGFPNHYRPFLERWTPFISRRPCCGGSGPERT